LGICGKFKTFDHNKTGVHCRLKTTDSLIDVIRQKRVNFYIESDGKMDFQDLKFSIVLIWWMIEKKNIQLLKNLHFDKRKNLNDKIQFSFLILNHRRR